MQEYLFLADCRPVIKDDERYRTLFPFGMGLCDDAGLGDAGERGDVILQVYRRNPFAAALDQVLGPVGQDEALIAIDPAHVARYQPVAVKAVLHRLSVVLGANPRAPHENVARGPTVMGQRIEILVDYFDLEARQCLAGFRNIFQELFRRACVRDPEGRRTRRENVASGLVSVMPHS